LLAGFVDYLVGKRTEEEEEIDETPPRQLFDSSSKTVRLSPIS
jgi:hypothetical protein